MKRFVFTIILLLGSQGLAQKQTLSPEEEVRRENVVLKNELRLLHERLSSCQAELAPLSKGVWQSETEKSLRELTTIIEKNHPGYNWTIDGGFVKKAEEVKDEAKDKDGH
jgi:uncharacterized protein YlxW (UPF0749 family)